MVEVAPLPLGPFSGGVLLMEWMMMASMRVAAVRERPLGDWLEVLVAWVWGWEWSFWKAARMTAEPWSSASLRM